MVSSSERVHSGREEEVRKLQEVACKVRRLVKDSPQLQSRMRSAPSDQSALIEAHTQACDQCVRKQRQTALAVAEQGLLMEPGSQHNAEWIELSSFEYPSLLLASSRHHQSVPERLRARIERSQAAYVANCLRQLLGLPLDPFARKPKLAIGNWRPIVRLVKREENQTPPHPNSDSIHDLKIIRKLNPNAIVTIACLRLGALANLGQIKEVIPEPSEDQGLMDRLGYVAALPTPQRERIGDAAPDPSELSPQLAEQLLEVLEEWVKTNSSRVPASSEPAEDEEKGLAITKSQKLVLLTMAVFDRSQLLSVRQISEEMEPSNRLSNESIRLCVRALVEAKLAERPNGDRAGARLRNEGRQLAGKIAD